MERENRFKLTKRKEKKRTHLGYVHLLKKGGGEKGGILKQILWEVWFVMNTGQKEEKESARNYVKRLMQDKIEGDDLILEEHVESKGTNKPTNPGANPGRIGGKRRPASSFKEGRKS